MCHSKEVRMFDDARNGLLERRVNPSLSASRSLGFNTRGDKNFCFGIQVCDGKRVSSFIRGNL